MVEISRELVLHDDPLDATFTAVDQTLTVLRQAHTTGGLELAPIEQRWLDMLSNQLDSVPRDEEQLLAAVKDRYGEGVAIWEEYEPLP